MSELPDLLGARNAAIITTPGALSRGTVEIVKRACGRENLLVFAGVQPNPNIASVMTAA